MASMLRQIISFRSPFRLLTLAVLAALLALGGCEGVETEVDSPSKYRGSDRTGRAKQETIFGEGGIGFFGDEKDKGGQVGGGIGVNAFLWRATLDTISFMPLTSADPFGGVIITDWYSPPESGAERFKMTVYILDKRLRADGLRVSIFRQEKAGADWRNAAVAENTATQLENAILQRARQLRLDSLGE